MFLFIFIFNRMKKIPLSRFIVKLIRFVDYFLRSFVGFFVFYFLMAIVFSIIPVNSNLPQKKAATIPVFILSNGVHTDLVLPVKNSSMDWSKETKFDHIPSGDTNMKYVAFGWGDKGFYLETPTWSDLKFKVAVEAMFYLGTSAMHVSFYKEMNESDHCVKLMLEKEAYQKLVTYIKNSFKRDDHGQIIHLDQVHYGNHDTFYDGIGSYGLFFTCNTWTNLGLKQAGLKACFWTPFDRGILYQYQ